MGILESAVDIDSVAHKQLWVVYGKSGSGKTHISSTFPKPLLYVGIGDNGSNTIREVKGIKAVIVNDLNEFKQLLGELAADEEYKTVVVDTFSLVVNEWVDSNVIKKGRRMTQQNWGDLKTDTEELIKKLHSLSAKKVVVLTCHEVTDAIEGMEDEITPDVRPNVSKGARTYLEAMANYGIHTTVVTQEVEGSDGTTKEISRHAIHLAPNPYYWVKTQKPAQVKLPKMLLDPSYSKIMQLVKGEKTNGKKAQS